MKPVTMKRRSAIVRDLRTPKYRPRVKQDKRRKLLARTRRRELRNPER